MSIVICYTRNRGIRFLYCFILLLYFVPNGTHFLARFLMRLSAIGLISAALSSSVYVRPLKKRVRRRRAGSFPKQQQGIELAYLQNSPEQFPLHLLSLLASNFNLKLSFSSVCRREAVEFRTSLLGLKKYVCVHLTSPILKSSNCVFER